MYLILGFLFAIQAISLPMPHIPRGNEAKPHSHPWILSLQFGEGHSCGASLLRVSCMENKSNVVLTAAHCLKGRTISKSNAVIKAGEHSFSKIELGEQQRKVKKIAVHEAFKSPIYNDVAVVQLDNAIAFSKTIQPVDLPPYKSRLAPDTVCTFAGWGYIRISNGMPFPDDLELPEMLQELDVVENRTVCESNKKKRNNYYNDDLMICAVRRSTGPNNTFSTGCHRDSGGPLVCKQGDHTVQYGVVSGDGGTRGCNTAGIFARVSTYTEWIKAQIKTFAGCDA